MSPLIGSADEAALLIQLQDKLLTVDARLAFAFLHLNFSRLGGCSCEMERHGHLLSLRVRDEGVWSYSFSAAESWVLGYVRPPEYRRGRIDLEILRARLPHAQDRGDRHLTVRIHSVDEARAFYDAIAVSRGERAN